MIADVLIVIDMQKGVLCENTQEIWHRNELITLVNQRISLYRAVGKPIIFVQHHDSELLENTAAWEFVSELDVKKEDLKVDKTHPNGFYQTHLLALLTRLSAHQLEFCGAQTEYCVNTTLVFAHGLGFENLMIPHATSTYDNLQMTAQATNEFYAQLWRDRFLTFID